MSKEELKIIVNKFSQQHILVVGDLMIDKYLWCSVDRISPEAPVPIAKVENETFFLGGAANTANNLLMLGVKVDVLGLIGKDENGRIIEDELVKKGAHCLGLIKKNKLPTITKTRIMCGNHQLLRFDYEEVGDINQSIETRALDFIKNNLNKYKVIILSDYAKGFITGKMAKEIIKMAKEANVKILSDPTPRTFYKFKDSYLIKPNRKEAELISNLKINDDFSNLQEVGSQMKKILNTDVLIITLGKDGMAIFNGRKNVEVIPTAAKEVYDVSGAGDSTIAAIAASLSSGSTIEEAAEIGNVCAGIVVGKLGTATCTSDELLKEFS